MKGRFCKHTVGDPSHQISHHGHRGYRRQAASSFLDSSVSALSSLTLALPLAFFALALALLSADLGCFSPFSEGNLSFWMACTASDRARSFSTCAASAAFSFSNLATSLASLEGDAFAGFAGGSSGPSPSPPTASTNQSN